MSLNGESSGPDLSMAKAVLGIGLVLVLFARGCDSIGQRAVAHANAKQQAARYALDDKYDDMIIQQGIRKERRALRKKQAEATGKEADDIQKDVDSLDRKEKKILEKKEKEEKQLQWGKWRGLKIAARDAADKNEVWSYWREWIFLAGSLLLMGGCLMVGFKGGGAERWVSLVMVAVVTFSLYVAGAAWVSSLTATMK